METTPGDEEESKLGFEIEKQICRCCLTTEKRMRSAVEVQQYFMELAGINVSVSDGIPQWVCFECSALMRKAVTLKYKMLRAHSMLYEYLMRCAPFSVEPSDLELARYRAPHLTATHTLAFDSAKPKNGYHTVLQHEKQILKSELYELPLVATSELARAGSAVKEEGAASDLDDDLPLEEFRSGSKEDENIEEDVKSEPEVKRRKKDKEPKRRKKKRTRMEKPKKTKEEVKEQRRLAARQVRERIKNDPILYEQSKQREKERYDKRKKDKKLLPICEMSTKNRMMAQKKNRENFRAYYKRQKEKEKSETIEEEVVVDLGVLDANISDPLEKLY